MFNIHLDALLSSFAHRHQIAQRHVFHRKVTIFSHHHHQQQQQQLLTVFFSLV